MEDSKAKTEGVSGEVAEMWTHRLSSLEYGNIVSTLTGIKPVQKMSKVIKSVCFALFSYTMDHDVSLKNQQRPATGFVSPGSPRDHRIASFRKVDKATKSKTAEHKANKKQTKSQEQLSSRVGVKGWMGFPAAEQLFSSWRTRSKKPKTHLETI